MADIVITERPQPEARRGPRGPEYTRVFDIIAGSIDDAYDLLRTIRNIQEGSVYQDPNGAIPDPLCVCTGLRGSARVAAVSGGSGLYEVSAEFGYDDHRSRLVVLPNGVRRAWLKTALASVPCDRDRLGRPIQTKAGQVFDPPVTKMIPQFTLCLEWRTSGPDLLTVQARYVPYLGKVNSVTYFGGPRGCLLCSDASVDEIPAGGISGLGSGQFRTHMEFMFRPEKHLKSYGVDRIYQGWTETLLHRGTMMLNSDGESVTIREDVLDATSPPIREPVLLDATATGYLIGAPEFAGFLDWEIYDYADFTTIPL